MVPLVLKVQLDLKVQRDHRETLDPKEPKDPKAMEVTAFQQNTRASACHQAA